VAGEDRNSHSIYHARKSNDDRPIHVHVCQQLWRNKRDPVSGKYPHPSQNPTTQQSCGGALRFRRTNGIPTRKGTRDQITNLRIPMHKAREHQQPLYVLSGLQEGIW